MSPMAGNIVAVVAGLLLIVIVLRDVFQGVIVPRAENTTLRISRYLMRGTWRVWPALAYRLYPKDEEQREEFFGVFAPFQLVTLLVVWGTLLVLGWGLVFYGLRSELRPPNMDFLTAVYYAGASLLTIGYGDVVTVAPTARILSLIAAASGLSLFAIVISFLFSIFAAFQRRERFVVTIGARAGIPPSGVGLLVMHADAGIREDVAQVFREGQAWIAEVMESHLAYPILMMFRSSHDFESWVGTLGTLLDAASLVLSTLDSAHFVNPQTHGQARITYSLGRHLTVDFSHAYNFWTSEPAVGVEREEFSMACDRLREAGYILIDERQAWDEFSRLRTVYGAHLNAMARWLEIPPVQWVGDRSMIARHKAHVGRV
jgi:hypothetical protein